jgi:hypothetical protein
MLEQVRGEGLLGLVQVNWSARVLRGQEVEAVEQIRVGC